MLNKRKILTISKKETLNSKKKKTKQSIHNNASFVKKIPFTAGFVNDYAISSDRLAWITLSGDLCTSDHDGNLQWSRNILNFRSHYPNRVGLFSTSLFSEFICTTEISSPYLSLFTLQGDPYFKINTQSKIWEFAIHDNSILIYDRYGETLKRFDMNGRLVWDSTYQDVGPLL